MPKFFIDVVHEVRIIINPKLSDEFYRKAVKVKVPLEKIEDKLKAWGAELNHQNQFKYPNQVSSGHLYFKNGKQLHIRVRYLSGGKYELKGHVEWHGVPHPVKHMMYFNLDYDLGYEILKELWDSTKEGIEKIKEKWGIR